MAQIHLLVLDLTRCGEGKALGGASFAFHLWHNYHYLIIFLLWGRVSLT